MTDRRITLGDDGRPVSSIDSFNAAEALRLSEAFAAAETAEMQQLCFSALGKVRDAAREGAREYRMYPTKSSQPARSCRIVASPSSWSATHVATRLLTC
jgi:hypothetical protein